MVGRRINLRTLLPRRMLELSQRCRACCRLMARCSRACCPVSDSSSAAHSAPARSLDNSSSAHPHFARVPSAYIADFLRLVAIPLNQRLGQDGRWAIPCDRLPSAALLVKRRASGGCRPLTLPLASRAASAGARRSVCAAGAKSPMRQTRASSWPMSPVREPRG